jgi:hypothetical protein
MAILYVDYEEGNNNYGGSSFDLLASGTDGRITSTTFSSSSSNFPNDGSLIDQNLSIWNGSIFAIYKITAWISSTSLTISVLGTGGTGLTNQTVNREFYIGGRWQSMSGATSVRIFPGDEIRVKASPDTVDTDVESTWVSELFKPTQVIQSTTNATPISVRRDAHGLSTGDYVVITGHTTNTNANGVWKITVTNANNFTLDDSTGNGVGGQSGSVRQINNKIITLEKELTKVVASTGNVGSTINGRTAWTAATNVTTSLDTTSFKEGHVSDLISIAAAFTTGKAAFKNIGSIDLSDYSQLSFWISQTSGTITVDGDISLCLCSDTNGDNVVYTFDIPESRVLNRWFPVTIDNDAALTGTIQSIALYINVDRGAQIFRFSNIIACKSPSDPESLCLNSLVSKSGDGTYPWVCIQSIVGRLIFIDGSSGSTPASVVRGYCELEEGTENVSLFTRLPTKTIKGIAGNNQIQSISRDGTPSAYIFVSGGWDRESMLTQTSETYFDGLNALGYGVVLSNRDYINISKMGFIRYTIGIVITGSEPDPATNIDVYPCQCNHCEFQGINLGNASFIKIENAYCFGNTNIVGNVGDGLLLSSGANNNTINNLISISNALSNLQINGCLSNNITGVTSINSLRGSFFSSSSLNKLTNFLAKFSISEGIYFFNSANRNLVYSPTIENSVICSISVKDSVDNVLFNASLLDPVEFRSVAAYGNGNIYSETQDEIADNHFIYTDYGLIRSETSIRHTDSGLSWSISPTNIRRDINYPLDFNIGRIAVSANNEVTIKAWLLRNNINLNMRLKVPGGQIDGVSSDVIANLEGSANEWYEVSLSFTPEQDGVVEFYVDAFGGSTHTGYVDDISITQV